MNSLQSNTPPNTRASKFLVVGIFAVMIGFFGLAFFFSLMDPADAQSIESPFKAWDGAWEGEYRTYKSDGTPIAKFTVRREYRHFMEEDRFHQELTISSTNEDTGEVLEEKAANSSTLQRTDLQSRILKKEGRVVVTYVGRIEDGRIFWTRKLPGVIESYHEWIDGDTYYLEGMTLYTEAAEIDPILFTGKFKRVVAEPSDG